MITPSRCATTGSGSDDGSADDSTTEVPAVDGIPDLGDLGGEEFGACIELTSALSAMAGAMSGMEIPPEAQQQIDDVKANLPDDVEKDFEIIVDGYKKFGEGDIAAASEAMSSPEFTKASDNMTKYIEEACSGNG